MTAHSMPTSFEAWTDWCLSIEQGRACLHTCEVNDLPPNPPLQRTGASVAALPLAPAAERPSRWADVE